ncbi:hypothetical protein ACH5RR_002767 [Cinchona calisaya]|uniref:Reverse transcriptase zinc-binding domain-containing protein n=1 Tax=Cinchona calisaya TaxID=153742 RepID=A0ABD3ATA5_9GENT
MRYNVATLFRIEIGNGQNTSFWFDNLHPYGQLVGCFSANLLTSFGCIKCTSVAQKIYEKSSKKSNGITLSGLKNMSQDLLSSCGWFAKHEENINHLFFSCAFTATVWQKIQALCVVHRRATEWKEEIEWIVHRQPRNGFTADLFKASSWHYQQLCTIYGDPGIKSQDKTNGCNLLMLWKESSLMSSSQ